MATRDTGGQSRAGKARRDREVDEVNTFRVTVEVNMNRRGGGLTRASRESDRPDQRFSRTWRQRTTVTAAAVLMTTVAQVILLFHPPAVPPHQTTGQPRTAVVSMFMR